MGYQEKASWATLSITLIVLVNYLVKLTTIEHSNLSLTGLLSVTFIWIIAATIVVHIILAILNAKEAEQGIDERDNIFDLTATRNSTWVIYISIFIAFSHLFLLQYFVGNNSFSLLNLANVSAAYNMANILMLGLLMSGLVHEITKLYYYRRGC